MIVCMCRGIRCTTIKAAISGGAFTLDAVGDACGAGTDCGGCRSMIEVMIEDVIEEGAPLRFDARGRVHLAMASSG
jgi:bacterioferritin-associated ferredoxin